MGLSFMCVTGGNTCRYMDHHRLILHFKKELTLCTGSQCVLDSEHRCRNQRVSRRAVYNYMRPFLLLSRWQVHVEVEIIGLTEEQADPIM